MYAHLRIQQEKLAVVLSDKQRAMGAKRKFSYQEDQDDISDR